MTTASHMTDVLRLHDLRVRLSQQRLQRAIAKVQQRSRLAAEGRAEHAAAEQIAADYVAHRFAGADMSAGAGQFIINLALGHRYAQREAVAMGARADRLSERQHDAEADRLTQAQDHLRMEQRKQQFTQIADDMLAGQRAAAEAQDDEEIQDIQAGRGSHGTL